MRRTVLLAFGLMMAVNAWAEQHMVEYLLPRGGTRGKSVEVTFHGTALTDPKEVLFYGTGLRAVNVKPGVKPAEEAMATIEILPDCAPGEHVLRLRTATALSEAVTFWVSRFPTAMETEKKTGENDTRETAQPLFSDTTVEGQIHPGPAADIDMYRADFTKGEHVSIEVEAIRLGTLHRDGENDLAVRILDPDGTEIARSDDSAMYVQDPLVSVIARKTGAYYFEIRQQVFYPPNKAYYRAHIGTFLRPTAVYPAGGQAGTEVALRLLGDPGGERTQAVRMPRQPGDFAFFAGLPKEQPPSPNMLRVSPYPNVLKTAGETVVEALPAALNGILAQAGQTDTFRYRAKKGETWHIRVFARTLGSPADPKIWIRALGSDRNLLEADDAKPAEQDIFSWRGTWHTKDLLDPVALFKPPADGEYVIGIQDSRGLASAESVYRIEIEPAKDAVYTHITMNDGYQIPRLVGMIIPQDNRWTMDVQLAPGFGNNYKGELDLEAVGLPRGVTMVAPRVKAGSTRTAVQFVAAKDAEPQAKLIELRARPVDAVPLESGSRQNFATILRGGDRPWHIVYLDKYAMAVTQPAPFHLELIPPASPIAQNGELTLKVKVLREPDFHGPVEIQTDWLPPNVSKEGTVTIPADANEGAFKINASGKAAAGVYKIAMNASTTTGDGFSGVGRVRVSSAFVDLKISETFVTADLKRASVERGQAGQMTASLKQHLAFAGPASVSLIHLPKGVTLVGPAPHITPQDTTVTFQLKADPDALVGLYKDIACDISFTENGQIMHQTTGSGVLRVDPSRVVQASR